jgi:hypothetical protein
LFQDISFADKLQKTVIYYSCPCKKSRIILNEKGRAWYALPFINTIFLRVILQLNYLPDMN